MPKLPFPPSVDDLRSIGAEEIVLPAGAHLARIYSSGGKHPTQWNQFRYWGPTESRFDHHLVNSDGKAHLQDRGIIYVAGHDKFGALATCLAEVYQDKRRVDRFRNEPFFVVFQIERDLHLLNLNDFWPTRAGASAAISTGPKRTARLWSQAIYVAYKDLDGILCGSSMAGMSDAVALFERSRDALPASPSLNRALGDHLIQRELIDALDSIGYLISK